MGINFELRIFNWVNIDFGGYTEIHKVNTLSEYRIGILNRDSFPIHAVSGIPLTTEILLKNCGAEISATGDCYENYRLPNQVYLSKCLKDVPYMYNDKQGGFYIGEHHKEIKYLHNLQNYLYEVYDFELDVKL
jgi:hypothetical protein